METGNIPDRVVSKFEFDIMLFNERYQMKNLALPGVDREQIIKELKNFKRIILDEVSEVDGIIEALEYKTKPKMAVLADLADWLGDIQIYAASEMVKFKLPIQQSLDIIMASNASKLGADGQPIKNPETEKIEKGPDYWKPEPFLESAIYAVYLRLKELPEYQ